jgi:hypothetical protein
VNQAPLNSIRNKRILLSPLNWGLGHVTRSIPIIKELNKHNEVYICCDENQEKIYRHYFPSQWYIPHSGYPFKFNGKGLWIMDFIKRIGSLLEFQRSEQKKVHDLVEKFDIDVVISDQRYGFRSHKTKNIIISHQVNLPLPALFFPIQHWNRSLIKKFDAVWIPDTKSQKFAGKLSRSSLKQAEYIGTCSRFDYDAIDRYIPRTKTIRYLSIISGPQPYNQRFFDVTYQKLKASNRYAVIIVPADVVIPDSTPEHIKIVQSPNHEDFLNLLLKTEIVISRAGYSTLMDLVSTENKAILVPTKGQHEQLYLAKIHQNNERWTFLDEEAYIQFELD